MKKNKHDRPVAATASKRRLLTIALALCSVASLQYVNETAPLGVRYYVYRFGLHEEERKAVDAVVRSTFATKQYGVDTDDVLNCFDLAFKARRASPWGSKVPMIVFTDAVLPYRALNEHGQSMRKEFYGRYMALVSRLSSPGKAAEYLDDHIYKDFGVKYSPRVDLRDLNPRLTIHAGTANCEGLSVMLVEACRAVGVSARIAGIVSWPRKGREHLWVEVWDNGWHYIGAGEFPPNQLDHTWFSDAASHTNPDNRVHAIFAVSPVVGQESAPFLDGTDSTMKAVNVTRSYLRAPRL